MTDQQETRDVCIVGAGPAGLTAGLFTARAGLDTLVVNAGEPILRRNAHLENVPGFPAGVNSRLFSICSKTRSTATAATARSGR
jgi:Thioredoxin reductase